MSKLFKLKEWLTLEEAANHISTVFGEPVTLADIYRLSLDEHLQISVYFLGGAKAKKGKFIKKEDVVFWDKELVSDSHGKPLVRSLSPFTQEIELSEDRWASLDSEVVTISGLWDLSMVGSEALDIARRYQKEISGSEVCENCLRGVFLHQGDLVCQLHSLFYDSQYYENSIATEEKFEEYITSNQLTDDESQELRDEFKFQNRFRASDDFERAITYQPSTNFDDHDYCLVIKTNEVTRFIQSLEDTPPEAKPLHDKERTTLLLLLGSILKKANFDLNERGIAGKIRRATESNNTPISEQTIRDLLPHLRDTVELKQR
jgi:hypothetical protein